MSSVDKETLDLLLATEFTETDSSGILTFHNEADPNQQALILTFTTSYDSPEKAARAELLTDFALMAARKGTTNHPGEDALVRAFTSGRVAMPSIYTKRQGDKLHLITHLKLPAGDKGVQSLDHALGLTEEILTDSLSRSTQEGQRVLEEARSDAENTLKDRMQDHYERTWTLFNERFFPDKAPLDADTQLQIVRGASLTDIHGALDKLLRDSFPSLVYSGDASLDDMGRKASAFARRHGGSGDAGVLGIPDKQLLVPTGSPIHETGPSDQMQLFQAYALSESPSTFEERAAIKTLNQVYGGGWTSKLMSVIRERHHLVYGIYSMNMSSSDFILATTEHDPQHYQKIIDLTHGLFEEVVNGNFTDDEFNAARDSLVQEMLVESTGHRGIVTCDQPAYRINHGLEKHILRTKDYELADVYTALIGLDPEEGRKAANKFLDPKVKQIISYHKEGKPQ